jgi:hypothetical protein
MGHISTPDKTREIPSRSDGNTQVKFGGVPKISFKLNRTLQPEGIEVDSSKSTRQRRTRFQQLRYHSCHDNW